MSRGGIGGHLLYSMGIPAEGTSKFRRAPKTPCLATEKFDDFILHGEDWRIKSCLLMRFIRWLLRCPANRLHSPLCPRR